MGSHVAHSNCCERINHLGSCVNRHFSTLHTSSMRLLGVASSSRKVIPRLSWTGAQLRRSVLLLARGSCSTSLLFVRVGTVVCACFITFAGIVAAYTGSTSIPAEGACRKYTQNSGKVYTLHSCRRYFSHRQATPSSFCNQV